MTVKELIADLQRMADMGCGDSEVVFKDENLYYYEIDFGAAKCGPMNGDRWDERMNFDCRVPSFVETKEDFYKLVVIE